MSSIRENVECILARSKRARKDDKHLMAIYWHDFDKIPFPMKGKDFVEMATSPASIIRARALIQSDGSYLPDVFTKERRNQREKDHRRALGKYKALPEDIGGEI